MFILRTLYTNLEFFIVLINFCFKQSKQLPIGQTHDLIDSCSKSKVRKNQRIIGINGKLRQDEGIGIEALSNPTEGESGPALRPLYTLHPEKREVLRSPAVAAGNVSSQNFVPPKKSLSS